MVCEAGSCPRLQTKHAEQHTSHTRSFTQVLDAIKGLRTMFFSKGAKLVPLKEMPDALAVPRSARGLEIARDSWVRIKSGLYKDDLAKVCMLFQVRLYSAHTLPCTSAHRCLL